MPTRSTKLASAKPVAGVNTVVLTVPPGYTYLLKDAVVANISGAGDTAFLWTADPAGVIGYLIQGQALAASTNFHWQGWVALNPGDTLTVLSNAGTSHFWVSGTKLPGIA